MREKLLKIIKHHGIMVQRRKLQEEVNEFLDEMLLYQYGDKSRSEQIHEEFADVLNVLFEFKQLLELDDVKLLKNMNWKLDRHLGEINK